MGAFITTSWDDGHPSDVRVAELLQKYGFQGTFFVPIWNRENRPVMTTNAMRSLSQNFEIGGHTKDHVYLDSISMEQAAMQIADGKRELEDIVGKSISGFAYPGGRYNETLKKTVSDQGFAYARTTENFRCDIGEDKFVLPTTFQLFPHSRQIYVRNLARYGRVNRRLEIFAIALTAPNLAARLRGALDRVIKKGGVFHLWGHSWELDMMDGWNFLEDFLRYASQRGDQISRVTNAGLSHCEEKLG